MLGFWFPSFTWTGLQPDETAVMPIVHQMDKRDANAGKVFHDNPYFICLLFITVIFKLTAIVLGIQMPLHPELKPVGCQFH